MEGNFKFKNIKPTLSTPTTQGKQLDTYFKKQMRPTGMNLKENGMLINEKEQSLKKKIFKLDKMETLVHTDENLSKIFNEMKADAAEKFGYHWNETILNIIFNDYVLNSPKYLHKYKVTRAKAKTRRGEEGIAQLQNDIDKEKEASTNAEDRKNDLLASAESKPKTDSEEKLDEWNPFKSVSTPAPVAPTSKDDTYFVDVRRKKLLGVVPAKASTEDRQRIMTPFLGKPDIKQLAWLAAYDMGVQGIPNAVSDGTTIDQVKQEMNAKYKSIGGYEGIPAMTEESDEEAVEMDYERPTEPEEDDCIVSSNGNKLTVSCGGNYIGTFVEDEEAFNAVKLWKEKNKYYPNTWFISDHGNASLVDDNGNMIDETTGSASSGAFSSGLDMQGKQSKEVADTTYQNETTTSASSGQYSGKAIWSKNGTPAANKPAWKGGKIIGESVINGDLDYLTDASSFKKYITKVEILQALNEDFMPEGNETFQQTAQRLLGKLHQYALEDPKLKNDPDYQDLLKRKEYEATSGKAYSASAAPVQQPAQQPATPAAQPVGQPADGTSQWKQPAAQPVSENELGIDEMFGFGKSSKTPAPVENPAQHATNLSGYKNHLINIIRNVKFGNQIISSLDKIYDQIIIKSMMSGVPPEKLAEKIIAHYNGVGTISEKTNNFKETLVKDLKYTGRKASEDESTDELEAKDGLFKGKWNTNEGMGGDPEVANEYLALENQMKQMIALKNAGKIDELKKFVDSLPMIPVASHAGSPTEFGHRDLEELGYLRCKYEAYQTGEDDYDHELMITNISNKPVAMLSNGHVSVIEPGQIHESLNEAKNGLWSNINAKRKRGESPLKKGQKGYPDKKQWNKLTKEGYQIVNDPKIDSIKDSFLPPTSKNFGKELNIDKVAEVLDNFKQSPDSEQFRNQFVMAKDFVKQKAGNIMKMPQLKMWLDQNMPQLSNYVSTLWGNWDLVATDKLTETKSKNMIDKNQYKELIKAKLKSSGKSLKNMGDDEKKQFFNEASGDYHQIKESMIDDQPDSMINNQEDSMVTSMDSDELNKDGAPAVAASSIGGAVEEGYDTDDMKAKLSIKDKFADYGDEEPTGDDEESSTDAVKPAELQKGTPAPQYYNQGKEDSEIAQDADKFRQALKAKYGVDSVSDLSHVERQELMKSMNFAGEKQKAGSVTKTDAERAEYEKINDPTQMLDYLNKNVGALKSAKDFRTLASNYKTATGQIMQHPMAIYGAIQKMSPEQRSEFAGLENYFKSNMDRGMNEEKSINEERKTSSILNVEKLGNENSKNFKTDTGSEDGISDDTNYPFKKSGIYNEKVWPDPSKFYIEQDPKKYQTAKSMADIERESLAKTKESLENIGDSTADGKNIPKRNLTKDEMYALAMNRGDGMQDIVYDNKPSEKFEKRMKADMGDNVYKARQDKMDYKADAPMYNKDSQPTENGDKKNQDNKFAKGYNNESIVAAKYNDEYGKIKLVEFKMIDVQELNSIDENAFKLSMDGMGNKYALVGKKINENVGYENITSRYDFYLHENNVYAVAKKEEVKTETTEKKQVVNESKFNKMKHLMNYKPSNYVDPNKSVKF
jgi:hypothetical protein